MKRVSLVHSWLWMHRVQRFTHSAYIALHVRRAGLHAYIIYLPYNTFLLTYEHIAEMATAVYISDHSLNLLKNKSYTLSYTVDRFPSSHSRSDMCSTALDPNIEQW